MNAHRIHRVAKLTGLSRDVIRVWERRFGLLEPTRGANRYRHYSDEDVSLLRYIKAELDKGASIGSLAAAGREELLARMRAQSSPPGPIDARGEGRFGALLEELERALAPFDRVAFERRLNGAVAVIPFAEALDQILLPLQIRVGELWHQGTLSVAVEHYVTQVVRQKVAAAMAHLPIGEQGPTIVVACPEGQLHDIGAQAVAYHCAVRGCRVYFLGADVPVGALVSFCADVRPDMVLLSFPLAPQAHELSQLLHALTERLTGISPVVAGGAGAAAMKDLFARFSIRVVLDVRDLMRLLLSRPHPSRESATNPS